MCNKQEGYYMNIEEAVDEYSHCPELEDWDDPEFEDGPEFEGWEQRAGIVVDDEEDEPYLDLPEDCRELNFNN